MLAFGKIIADIVFRLHGQENNYRFKTSLELRNQSIDRASAVELFYRTNILVELLASSLYFMNIPCKF